MDDVLRSLGERLRQELPLKPVPFRIALMVEHLRRAESEHEHTWRN